MFPRRASTGDQASPLLMFVSGYVYRLLRYEARRVGIPWTALMVLRDLDLLGPSNQKTLAEIEQIRAPTLTVLLQRMEGRGWVRRAAARSDARVSMVSITPRGRTALEAAGRQLRRRLDEELKDVPREVLRDLEGSLAPLAEALMSFVRVARTPPRRSRP